MGTGHRDIAMTPNLRTALLDLITTTEPDAVRSGGAPGFDTYLAEAAIDSGVPLLVDLPNRYYRRHYTRAIYKPLLDRAAEVRYIVDRPERPDWRTLWKTERWWLDNLARNHAMVDSSTVAVVCSVLHPHVLNDVDVKGGTAECVRYIIAKSEYPGVWWLPIHRPSHEWVPIDRQGVLL